MIILNENDFPHIDPMIITIRNIKVLEETTLLTEEEKEVKKKGVFLKVIKSLLGKDLSKDEDSEKIYYALSSVMSISYIIGGIPLIGILPRITAKHLMTGTLPKYRRQLMHIYDKKEKETASKIKEIKDMIADENDPKRKDILKEEEKRLIEAKNAFNKEYKRIAVFDDRKNDDE